MNDLDDRKAKQKLNPCHLAASTRLRFLQDTYPTRSKRDGTKGQICAIDAMVRIVKNGGILEHKNATSEGSGGGKGCRGSGISVWHLSNVSLIPSRHWNESGENVSNRWGFNVNMLCTLKRNEDGIDRAKLFRHCLH